MFDRPFISVYILPEAMFLVEVGSDRKRILQSIRVDLPKGLIKNYVVTDTDVFSQSLKKIWAKYKLREKHVAIVLSEFAAFTKLLTLPKVPVSEMHEAVLWAVQEYLPEDIENMLFDWKIIAQNLGTTDIFVVAAKKEAIISITDSFEKSGVLPFFVEIPSLSLARMDNKKTKGSLIVYDNPLVSLVIFSYEGNVLGSAVVRGNDPQTLLSTAKKMNTHYKDRSITTLYYSGLAKELYDELEKTFRLIPKPLVQTTPENQPDTHTEYLIPYSLAMAQLSEPADPFSINLLPQAYVEKYRSSTKKVQFWGLILTVTLFVWVSLFACLATYLFITQSNTSLKKTADSQSLGQKRTETANMVKQMNTTADAVLQIKNISVLPQDALNIINLSRPEGISISQYKFDFDLGDIKIDGVAKDRLSLIEFKQNMQKSDQFGSVDIPISNFETETNLTFQLTAKYTPVSKKLTLPSKTPNQSKKSSDL